MRRLFDKQQEQQFHKSRQDRMLLPHRSLSGLLFTINPRQEERAKREIIQFMEFIVKAVRDELESIQKESKELEHVDRLTNTSNNMNNADENFNKDKEKNEIGTYNFVNKFANMHCTNIRSIDCTDESESYLDKSTSSLLTEELNKAAAASSASTTKAIMGMNTDNNYNSDLNNSQETHKRHREDCGNYQFNEQKIKGATNIMNNAIYENKTSVLREPWLLIRETNCKGYLFVQIPVINVEQTCVKCNHIELVQNASEKDLKSKIEPTMHSLYTSNSVDVVNVNTISSLECEKICEPSTLTSCKEYANNEDMNDKRDLLPHSIIINPLVSFVVERVFNDLLSCPRIAFRSCFRLYPVELCCCPTLHEMQVALRALLNLHFPIQTNEAKKSSSTSITESHHVERDCVITNGNNNNKSSYNNNANLINERVLSDDNKSHEKTAIRLSSLQELRDIVPTLHSHAKYKHKSLHTIALHVNVKNNTNVEEQKHLITSQLAQCIPANRFIVVSPQYLNQSKKYSPHSSVEAVICINVLHSTCCIGIQSDYADRLNYNVHDISSNAWHLNSEENFKSRVGV